MHSPDDRTPPTTELAELTAVLAYAPLAVATTRGDVGIWCNQRMTDLFGWTLDELRDQDTRQLFANEAAWREFRGRAVSELARSEQTSLEYPFRHKSGRVLSIRAHGRVSPRPGEVIWFFEDVTAQREAERGLKERQELLDGYFRSPAVGIAVSDVDSGFVDVNPAFCQFLGRAPEELLGTGWESVTAPEDRGAGKEARQLLLDGESESCTFEKRYLHKDGTERWAHVTLSLVEPGTMGRRRIVAMVQDASAQVHARVALRESEERMRSTFAAMAEGVVVQDASGRIVLCNPAAERILGLTRAQMEGRDSMDPRWRAIHEDGSPFPGETHPGMVTLHTGQPLSGVIMGVETPEGALRWISIASEPMRLAPDRAPHAVVATFTDITGMRRDQALLREREAQLERVIRGSNDGYFEWNLATGHVERSPRVADMLGLPQHALAPTREAWLARVHPDDLPALCKAQGDVADGTSASVTHEYRVRAADGTWRWLLTRARRAGAAAGGTGLVSGTFTDVTERHEAEEALAEALAGLAEAQRIAHVGSMSLDFATGRRSWSDEALAIHGVARGTDVLAHATELLAPADLAAITAGVARLRSDGEPLEHEHDITRLDGSKRRIVTRIDPVRGEAGAVTGVHCTYTDVTEERAAQSVMADAERARLVGQLAGGIAHDYNNLLTTIIGNSEFLAESLPAGSQQALDNAAIQGAAKRAAELTDQLLSYGRRQMLRPRALDSAKLVEGLLPLARSACGRDVTIAVRSSDPPPVMIADRSAVEQALLNLVLNAAEAMSGIGPIAIRIDRVELRDGDPALRPHAHAGPFLRLAVSDTGRGIAPEHLPHIFEPFFSTKDPSAGAGLGLASVDGAMVQLGGLVTVESWVGQGTTVALLLPAAASGP